MGIPWMIFLALLEGAACFFQQPYLPKQLDSALTMVEPNPTRVWQYKKNYSQQYSNEEFTFHIQTNSLGLRDREIEHTNANLRVLVIGNSFTFGWGVQQSQRYTEFLQGILQNERKNTKVHVLNAGYWFYTFDQQLLLLKEMLPVYKPHLVLQGFYGPHVLNLGEHSWERDSSGSLVSINYVRSYDNEIKVNPDGSLRLTNHLIEEPPLSSCFIREAIRRYYCKLPRQADSG